MESVISGVISGVLRDLEQPGLMPGLEEERQKLLNLLQAVLPVLSAVYKNEDIDECADSSPGQVASVWIKDLKAAAYETDDIVDEFRYAKLLAEAETNHRQHGGKVRTGIFTRCKNWCTLEGGKTETKLINRERLGEVASKFEDLVERLKHLAIPEVEQLMPNVEDGQHQASSSLKELENVIVGRDEEKEMLVRQLIDLSGPDCNAIRAISIIGMPGIGKTTLARFICDDDRIKDHFEHILWVLVGQDFDIGRIVKSVIDEVRGKDCCLSEHDTDLLKNRVNQELSGKRCLLVLDDVWDCNKDKWHQLMSWLGQSVATGSSLLATSAFTTMQKISNVFHISHLTYPELFDIFCRRAFITDTAGPEVHKSIEKMINHSSAPLWVNLMGSLMRFQKESKGWQQIIRQLTINRGKYDIEWEQVFQLCYSHLSSEMKQCIVFCSLFPEGHYMDREVLVKLWIADGLIYADGPTPLEEKGYRIFHELALRHFLEDVKHIPESSSREKYGYHGRVICKMHATISMLVQYHSRDEILRILTHNENQKASPLQARYLCIHGDSLVDFPELLKNYPHMRSLIFSDDPFHRTVNCCVLPRSKSLRVLHMRFAKFNGDLFELTYTKHLRYLDLSGSRIKRMPKSTRSLYLLQTLKLSNCLLLCQLPEDMRYMRSLRHLYIHECPKLKKMPGHLGELGSLKTLTTYIIGETSGNGIDEIKSLNLSGLLELYNLRKVKDKAMAGEANLSLKRNLERLTLCWGGKQLAMLKENNDLAVMEALQPHTELKVLKVQQYGGPEFATWLVNPAALLNLVELHLIGCSECKTLPAVWKLGSLQVLCLKHMVGLTSMFPFTSFPDTEEKDSSKLFKSLKRLVLVGLRRLKRWHEGGVLSFSKLDEMEITDCPELETMPSVPTLGYLTISIENHMLLCSVIDLMTLSERLVEVYIAKGSSSDDEALSVLRGEMAGRNCHNLRVMRLDSTDSFFMPRAIPYLRLEFWKSLNSLENLDIFNCNSITAWPLEEFRSLSKLKRLSMRTCPHLTGVLPSQLQKGEVLLPQLISLQFYRCLSMNSIPKCSSISFMELDECPEINSIPHFNNLEMLFLSCTSWTTLPTGFEGLKKLESLRVSECYSLICLPNELAGLTSLRTLIIKKCPRVKSLPKDLHQMLYGLTKFQVSECPELEQYCRVGPYSSIISQISNKRLQTQDHVDASGIDDEDGLDGSGTDDADASGTNYED